MNPLLRSAACACLGLAATAGSATAQCALELAPNVPPNSEDYFGNATALRGDVALVSAPNDDGNLNQFDDIGAVYAYRRIGGTWQYQHTIRHPGPVSEDMLNNCAITTAAITGDVDIAIVGSGNISAVSFENVGEAYVYYYNPSTSTWEYQNKVLQAQSPQNGDYFGGAEEGSEAIAIYNDAVVIGAPGDDLKGKVYMFLRNFGGPNNWRLADSELGALDDDQFGWAVAIDDNTVIAGAAMGDGAAVNSGTARILQRSGNTLIPGQVLQASDGTGLDHFGAAVDIQGNRAVVGAWSAPPNNRGAVYIFENTGATWSQTQKLLGAGTDLGDRFGFSVALDGNRIAVGTPFYGEGTPTGPGRVYFFEYNGSTWVQTHVTDGPEGGAEFGQSLELRGNDLLIGSIGVNDNPESINVGRGFLYKAVTCAADIDDDFCVEVNDLTAVIVNWGCTNPPGPCPGDVTNDGVVDVQDLVEVIVFWGPCVDQGAPQSFYECVERCDPTQPSCIIACGEMFGLFD